MYGFSFIGMFFDLLIFFFSTCILILIFSNFVFVSVLVGGDCFWGIYLLCLAALRGPCTWTPLT